MRRLESGEDLQCVAILLRSKVNDFVNGHIIYVDCGIVLTIGKLSN